MVETNLSKTRKDLGSSLNLFWGHFVTRVPYYAGGPKKSLIHRDAGVSWMRVGPSRLRVWVWGLGSGFWLEGINHFRVSGLRVYLDLPGPKYVES